MFDVGETVPFKSSEERKDLYKVSFSINIYIVINDSEQKLYDGQDDPAPHIN